MLNDTGPGTGITYATPPTPDVYEEGAAGPSNMAPALTAFSGLTSAFANYQSGRINKSINDYNATLSRLQSEQALQAGQLQDTQRQLKEGQTEGNTRAAFASQGVQANTGTANSVVTSEAAMSSMDRLMIETNARRAAMGYNVRAAADTFAGQQAKRRGTMGAVSSLLDTGAQEELESDPNYRGYRGRGVST